MALAFPRLCACVMVVAACSAPRLSDTPSQKSVGAQPTADRAQTRAEDVQPRAKGAPRAEGAPRSTVGGGPRAEGPQPLAAGPAQVSAARADALQAAAIEQPPAPDAEPDESGWGVAAGLRYLEIVRGGAAPDDKLPMVVVIHGLGDKPSRDWLYAIDLDPSLKARMILPQAPTPSGPGFSWFPYRFRDWNDAGLSAGISKAATGLTRAIEQLTRMRPTRGRIIVCGFSQGGMLSFALSLAHPELFQLALPISGMLPRPMWPESKPRGFLPRIVALHGTADQTVPFDADSKLVEHLRGLRFPVEIAGYDGVEHHISPAMSARVRAELSAAVAGKH